MNVIQRRSFFCIYDVKRICFIVELLVCLKQGICKAFRPRPGSRRHYHFIFNGELKRLIIDPTFYIKNHNKLAVETFLAFVLFGISRPIFRLRSSFKHKCHFIGFVDEV